MTLSTAVRTAATADGDTSRGHGGGCGTGGAPLTENQSDLRPRAERKSLPDTSTDRLVPEIPTFVTPPPSAPKPLRARTGTDRNVPTLYAPGEDEPAHR